MTSRLFLVHRLLKWTSRLRKASTEASWWIIVWFCFVGSLSGMWWRFDRVQIFSCPGHIRCCPPLWFWYWFWLESFVSPGKVLFVFFESFVCLSREVCLPCLVGKLCHFANASAVWSAPEAPGTVKWSRLISKRYPMLSCWGWAQREFKPLEKTKRIVTGSHILSFEFFSLLELGFALCRLWLCPVFSFLK